MRHLSRRAQLCHWSSLLRSLAALTDGPILLEAHSRRFGGGEAAAGWLLGGAELHNPLVSALRPQLTGRPTRWGDLDALRDLKLGPCSELTSWHVCLDV